MSDKTAAIIKALGQLDPANSDHWTNDGLPRLDAIKGVSGLKREDVTAAAPLFTKDNPSFEVPEAQGGDSTSGQGADAEPTPPADQGGQDQEGAGDDEGNGDEGDDQGDEDDLIDAAEELDEAEAAVLEAKAVLEEAQAAANDAKAKVDAAQAEVDRMVEARDAQKRPHQDMEDRMAFIRRQHEQRAARAGAAAEALKGVDLAKLDPRSALDRSMARKVGFGHRPRPQLPLKKGE